MASSPQELAARREKRRKVPVHIAPRVPGAMVFSAAPAPLCGVARAHGVKIAAAAGIATCPDCRRIYRERIGDVKEKGRRYWALAHANK
jgi:hypothetical protein